MSVKMRSSSRDARELKKVYVEADSESEEDQARARIPSWVNKSKPKELTV